MESIAKRELLDRSLPFSSTFKAIEDEVDAQDRQWGGVSHDREHTNSDWASYIEKQIGCLLRREGDSQERYIKIAALCVSAIRASLSCEIQCSLPPNGQETG